MSTRWAYKDEATLLSSFPMTPSTGRRNRWPAHLRGHRHRGSSDDSHGLPPTAPADRGVPAFPCPHARGGDGMRSRTLEVQRVEVQLGCRILNTIPGPPRNLNGVDLNRSSVRLAISIRRPSLRSARCVRGSPVDARPSFPRRSRPLCAHSNLRFSGARRVESGRPDFVTADQC